MTSSDDRSTLVTQHTFKPETHYLAYHTMRHLNRHRGHEGIDWASRTGPTFGHPDPLHSIKRYENVRGDD